MRAQTQFLPRADFAIGGEAIASRDSRFRWNGVVSADVDVAAWTESRVTLFALYEVVADNKLRTFAPNSGNYVFEPSMAWHAGPVDVAAEFHHESRHLADAPKITGVDWNMVGGRVLKAWTSGPWSFAARADVRKVLYKTFVDYTGELEGQLRTRYAWRSRADLASHVTWHTMTVNGSRRRGAQTGVRVEGSVRMKGDSAAVELFLAVERRIDPYPLEFSTDNRLTAGFRLASR